MNEEKIEKLKDQVRYIMVQYPGTRDDDKLLTLGIWIEFFPEKIYTKHDENMRLVRMVALTDTLRLPSQDHISRIRRKIQEGGELLPTTWEVAQKRKINEQTWKSYMLTH